MLDEGAEVPRGGVVFENHFGTAPGLVVQNDRTVAILLPPKFCTARSWLMIDAWLKRSVLF